MIRRLLRSLRTWFNRPYRELKQRARQIEQALEDLVYLKDMKSLLGKTPEHAARQRMAWLQARHTLGRKPNGLLRPIRRIEITFPAPVHMTTEDERHLDQVVAEICDRWRDANPDRVMWPAGHGSKITYMPLTRAEEEAGRHMEFDDDVYAIDCSERERYPTDHH